MQVNELQELLLDAIPGWHFWFVRPFKKLLDEGVSLDMYYCIQALRRHGEPLTMTELSRFARMPKQQVSKMVDRLVDTGFVERLSDPDDRRVIRLRTTAQAEEYIHRFFEKDAADYRTFFEMLTPEERECFCHALADMNRIFTNQRDRLIAQGKLPGPPPRPPRKGGNIQ